MLSPPIGCAVVYLVTLSLSFKGRNVNPEGLVRTHWAVKPSVALQGVSASVRKVRTGLRTRSAALIIPQAPCASPLRDTWQGFLILSYKPTTRAGTCQMKTLAFCWCEGVFTWTDHLSRSAEGHGSTLWCDSFTIWRYLCCFPVGIWGQLRQDDACSGHLEVSLSDFIRRS